MTADIALMVARMTVPGAEWRVYENESAELGTFFALYAEFADGKAAQVIYRPKDTDNAVRLADVRALSVEAANAAEAWAMGVLR